jgi:hypothetical protein
MTFTKCLPDDRCKENLEHVINNISHYEKPSPLMEALVNNAGAKDLLDFYRLFEMSPGDVDSLEVTTSEGQVPLAGGYKAFIRNFQGMYSVCEKQINWSDGMLLALRWEDYRAYMCITSHNSWCYSGKQYTKGHIHQSSISSMGSTKQSSISIASYTIMR